MTEELSFLSSSPTCSLPCAVIEAKSGGEKSNKEDVRIEDSLGRVGGEFVIPYPPGVAVLAPGEVIDQELIDFLVRAREMNIDINGMESHALDKIKVIK